MQLRFGTCYLATPAARSPHVQTQGIRGRWSEGSVQGENRKPYGLVIRSAYNSVVISTLFAANVVKDLDFFLHCFIMPKVLFKQELEIQFSLQYFHDVFMDSQGKMVSQVEKIERKKAKKLYECFRKKRAPEAVSKTALI